MQNQATAENRGAAATTAGARGRAKTTFGAAAEKGGEEEEEQNCLHFCSGRKNYFCSQSVLSMTANSSVADLVPF